MNAMSRKCQNGLRYGSKLSGGPFPPVRFVYLSVECPFNEFHRINCRPKLRAKLLNRFFHRRRQVSPPVDGSTHRFFDGLPPFLSCNVSVGPRHGAPLLPADSLLYAAKSLDRLCPSNSHCTGTTAGAPLSLIKSTRNFAGLVLLAFRSTT